MNPDEMGLVCVERKGHGFTERLNLWDWADDAIQDHNIAADVARAMLSGRDPYEWNENEPEFYETFHIIDRSILEEQLAELDKESEA